MLMKAKSTNSWFNEIRVHFPDMVIANADLPSWEDFITDKLDDVTDKELRQAIRANSNMNGKITPTLLVRWVKDLRDRAHDAEHAGSVARLKEQLKAATPGQRWEIICCGKTAQDCHTLKAYAESLPGGHTGMDKQKHATFVDAISGFLKRDDIPIGDGYVRVNAGETIQPGDEYYIKGEWRPFSKWKFGRRFVQYADGAARRKIKAKPKVREVKWNDKEDTVMPF